MSQEVINVISVAIVAAVFLTVFVFSIYITKRWLDNTFPSKSERSKVDNDQAATIKEAIKAEVAKATTINAAGK